MKRGVVMEIAVLLFLSFVFVSYLLYRNGVMITNVKRAIFILNLKKASTHLSIPALDTPDA